jgi:hypothetical protein
VSKRQVLSEIRELVEEAGLPIEPNVGYPWMTNRVPIEDDTSTPARVLYRLSALHVRLGGDWEGRLAKRETQLRFDFLVRDDTLIEVDPVYRFTSARMSTLDFYDGVESHLDVDRYRELCETYAEDANRPFGSKGTADFPFEGGRAYQAAFFDFAKDVLAPAHGFRLVRLPAPEGELTSSLKLTLRVLL